MYIKFFSSKSSGLKSYALVNLKVLDINDNAPELINGNLHVCENDTAGTVRSYLNTFHINKFITIFLLAVYFHNSSFITLLQIIGTVGAYDKDESSKRFHFTLAKKSSNFSLHDNESEFIHVH